MQNREMQRDKQVAQMLFTLKIMFMLFSMFPVFEKAFGDRKSGTLTQVKPSLMGILILVAAVGVLGVFLFSTFAEFKKRRVVLLLELPLFFALYILTLWMSGLHTSNYKFLFLFVIIYYTIAHSKQMGFLVAAGGSDLVLGLDLFTGNSQDVNVYFQQDLALVVSFFVVAQCLGLFVRVQREYAAYLEECARMDGLTGVYNHRSFHQLLEAAAPASVETDAPLSVIMMDIDFFKKYNDLYGHQQGDEVLRSIAAEVGAHLRPEQTLARYGGEEFAVILPGLAMQEAQKVAVNVYQKIELGYRTDGSTPEGYEVVDDEGKYVGTITEGDLLWEIKEKYTLTVKAAESIALRDVRRRRDNEPVNVLSNMEGLIMKVMNQNFVPVVDDRGAFMGIITRRAVIGYLYEKLGVAENNSDKK